MARSNKQPPTTPGEYEPGTTVLVRAKGYPAWPAVVIGDEDVPESVLKAKPRKKTVFPVLFYNDFSFLWLTPYDCKPLTPEAARKAAQASRIGKQVKDAYLVAADPPDYKEYVASATQPAEPEPEPEPEEVPEPAPTSRKARSRGRAKPASDRASAAPKPVARVSTTSRKRSTEPEPASKKKQKVEEPEVVEADVSEEAGDDEYVENSTPEDSDYSEGPNSDDLATSQEARLALCSQVRQVAQETLLEDGKMDEDRLAASLKLIEDAPEIEISVIRRSKLNRVFAAALLYSSVPASLLPKIEELHSQWNTSAEPVIRGIPEDLAPKEETVEPEDLVSKDPTEEPSDADQIGLKQDPSLPSPDTSAPTASEPPSVAPSVAPSEAPSVAPSEAPSEVPQSTQGNEVASDAPEQSASPSN